MPHLKSFKIEYRGDEYTHPYEITLSFDNDTEEVFCWNEATLARGGQKYSEFFADRHTWEIFDIAERNYAITKANTASQARQLNYAYSLDKRYTVGRSSSSSFSKSN